MPFDSCFCSDVASTNVPVLATSMYSSPFYSQYDNDIGVYDENLEGRENIRALSWKNYDTVQEDEVLVSFASTLRHDIMHNS